MNPPQNDPLILTLTFEAEAAERFDGMRRTYFPAALNRIPAHVTLFHHLAGNEEDEVREAIARETRAQAPVEVAVTGLRFTGRGVAYVLASDALSALRARLAQAFAPMLTAQDRQGWRPHVTIQNKVAPEVARALHGELVATFVPFSFIAPGLTLWRYLSGPWAHRADFAFSGEPFPMIRRCAP
ncbi:MAG: 2'-5' RNA ligase family protein [Methylobacterium sp.]|uniref:2'-5' RNA ligase family protein n=1 Tax=Methylobacterium sp. TaxID=409 RepID=UPI0025F3E97E|nr:2'-5' RNA ligase family protein [Methylobacterium sp.]MBX9934592.1 2'-5' RNA ligase family protein [Methylobacterium sp.]